MSQEEKQSTTTSKKKTTVSKKNDEKKTKAMNDVDLSSYISNTDGNIYAITGLPEEFIATLFAWVSRSPKSFKEHLKEALTSNEIEVPSTNYNYFAALSEKAKKFHEKWTVGYGHSSVAEHAVAHVGIEKVSRLASSELELSNPFLSFTEYSQRYQKPKRGDWYVPDFKANDPLRKKYIDFMNQAFDAFEKLIDGVYNYLVEHHEGELTKKDQKAYEKLAFEDARYVLPLAMYTQLGMTGNGRALRDSLAKLETSAYPEVRQMADSIRTEVSKVLPVLLKHSHATPYMINRLKREKNHFRSSYSARAGAVDEYVRTLSADAEDYAINKLVALWYAKHGNFSYQEGMAFAKHMDKDQKIQIIKDVLFEMGEFDNPPEEFKTISYKVEFMISEACWHQLLRHSRKINFVYNLPTVDLGLTIPPRVKKAGLKDLIQDVALSSVELYYALNDSEHPESAAYVVLNAHHRLVIADFDLWEAYHLINLRTSEEAQWDIRQICEQLYQQLLQLHPVLISQAQRRKNQ